MTDTIQSYELKFHPVPHDVIAAYELYTWGSHFVTGTRVMSLQLAAVLYILVHITLYRIREKSGGGGKGNCTQTRKCTAVQVC